MSLQPIDTAPAGDGWILGYVPDINGLAHAPWIIATRCDGGWSDHEGYGVEPSGWAPLPDPQPKPTGWRKAEGTVNIAAVLPGGPITNVKYVVFVKMPCGESDPMREPSLATSAPDARQRAAKMAQLLGLPLGEDATDNVVPFDREKFK